MKAWNGNGREETESEKFVGEENMEIAPGAGSSKDGALNQEVVTEEREESTECEKCGDEPREEGEEGRTAKGRRAPQKISKKEREEHDRTHTPYRAWCPYCVKGRGKNTQHRAGEDEARGQEREGAQDFYGLFLYE